MSSKKSNIKWLAVLAGVVVLAALGALIVPWGTPGDSTSAFFVAENRDLKITVLESGSLKALKAQEVKCEVDGQSTVLYIIPEGTVLTEEDVNNERLLVELDSSDLSERLTSQNIELQSAEASRTQARESFEIQKNQNESNIKAGELRVKFARMDREKYLGAELAAKVVPDSEIAFAELVEDEALDGDARQRLRALQSNIDLAEEEVKRAQYEFEWTEKLEAQKYVSFTELEADRLALRRQKIALEQAQTALDLFTIYEFAKDRCEWNQHITAFASWLSD